MLLLGAALVLAPGTAAYAEDPPPSNPAPFDQGAALRRAARRDVPLAERLAAVESVLAADVLVAPTAALRAGVSLLDDAPLVACWLLKAGADGGAIDEATGAAVVQALGDRLGETDADRLPPLERARLAAAGMLFALRPVAAPSWIAAVWDEGDAFLHAVVDPEIGRTEATAAQVHADLEAFRPTLAMLDLASRDDQETSRQGLDALLAQGAEALPALLAETHRATTAFVPGRRERATRAILVLGLIRDRQATPALIAALQSKDGWVRTYAAVALGDLGDPAAVIALVRQMTLLGDPLRDRDQWEYPGATITTVPESDWASAEYHAIDTQAASALLRLGVRGAIGWLIDSQLDPRGKNYRIRVLQDATDAIRRAAPGAPMDAYGIDAGLPHREAAFEVLADWWHAHRDDDRLLEKELDPQDARFHAAALGLVDVLSGESGVREMMMANAAVDLLGPLMTPALIEAAKAPKSPFHKAEIAQALGRVRSPDAIPALIDLVRERTPFIRAKAAVGLGPYARDNAGVRRVLLKLIGSKNAAVRVAAMQSLVFVPRDDAVRDALKDWVQADIERVAAQVPTWRTPDVVRALAVLQFVQEGESQWGPVEAGLEHEQRVERRTWWDLVRAALDVPEYLHDPVAKPGATGARRFSKQRALEARTP